MRYLFALICGAALFCAVVNCRRVYDNEPPHNHRPNPEYATTTTTTTATTQRQLNHAEVENKVTPPTQLLTTSRDPVKPPRLPIRYTWTPRQVGGATTTAPPPTHSTTTADVDEYERAAAASATNPYNYNSYANEAHLEQLRQLQLQHQQLSEGYSLQELPGAYLLVPPFDEDGFNRAATRQRNPIKQIVPYDDVLNDATSDDIDNAVTGGIGEGVQYVTSNELSDLSIPPRTPQSGYPVTASNAEYAPLTSRPAEFSASSLAYAAPLRGYSAARERYPYAPSLLNYAALPPRYAAPLPHAYNAPANVALPARFDTRPVPGLDYGSPYATQVQRPRPPPLQLQSNQYAYAPLRPHSHTLSAPRIPVPYPPSFISITTRRPYTSSNGNKLGGNTNVSPRGIYGAYNQARYASFRPSQPDPTPDLFSNRETKSLLDSYIPSWEVVQLIQQQQQQQQQQRPLYRQPTFGISQPPGYSGHSDALAYQTLAFAPPSPHNTRLLHKRESETTKRSDVEATKPNGQQPQNHQKQQQKIVKKSLDTQMEHEEMLMIA